MIICPRTGLASCAAHLAQPLQKLGTLLVLALGLTACATATPYQSASNQGYGIVEEQIESNRYRVSFAGNSLTRRNTVENYVLFRAAELTVEKGQDYFVVVNQSTDERKRYRSYYDDWGPFGYYPGFYYHRSPFYYHRRRFASADTVQITNYTASADIVLYSGTKPGDNPDAYDAREVMKNIGPSIVRPEDLTRG